MNERNNNIRKLLMSESVRTCSNFYQSKKFRIFSNRNRNINKKNSMLVSNIKNLTLNNIKSNKFFDSFHKYLMHRKLSSNKNFVEIENRICYSERESKAKNYLENTSKTDNISNKNKNYEKLFLTNYNDSFTYKTNNEIINNKYINRPIYHMNTVYNKENTYNGNDNKIYRSNVFLPLDLKRFRNNGYPDVLYPKISDFIEDIKMLRISRFINNVKKDQFQQNYASAGFNSETLDVTIHSLQSSIKLLYSYKVSFGNYNKFLIEKIKEEKNLLSKYIIDENKLKEESVLIQKKFDDLMIQYEILNNFKLLFDAIKNKTKIKNENELFNKTFAERTKEKLKQKLFKKKNSVHLTPKYLSKRKTRKLDKKRRTQIKREHLELSSHKSINKHKNEKEEKEENHNRRDRKYQTVLDVKYNETKKNRLLRLKSLQPTIHFMKNNIHKKEKNNLEFPKKNEVIEYDVGKELKIINNNILRNMHKYNNIESYVVNCKLLLYKESNDMYIIMIKKEIQEKIQELNFSKKYNTLLNSKLNFIKSKNKDYSLFIIIYHKINEIVNFIKDYKIKNYQILITQLKNTYDKKRIYISYINEKKENISKRSYLEAELITYIYKILIIIEKLVHALIQGKNDYLKSNYFSERFEEYENKIDNAKKLFNNRNKKNEEILRREKVNENTVKKLSKLVYIPRKKVIEKYQLINIHKVKKEKKENEDNIKENLLFY